MTVHHEPCDELDRLRDHFAARPRGHEEFIVYKVLDALADSFFPALAAVDDEIDALEDAIVTHADEQQLQRIFQLKKELVRLRRIATPQRDLLRARSTRSTTCRASRSASATTSGTSTTT